jgi:1-acyl-sn-glycerol-3-phosphate acyltransferase
MDWVYRACRLGGRFIFFCTMRLQVIRPEAGEREGPYVLACTHVGHLDPFLMSVVVRRSIDWMTRVEFFRHRVNAWMIRRLNGFAVRRFGVPVSAIRTAIGRLGRGRIVGICPEGGVCRGAASVMQGGRIKRGTCLISYRTGAPVLPCIILGSNRLNCVGPWLPFRRARLWVAFGDRMIQPRMDLERRAAREAMALELEQAYARLFAELCESRAIPPEMLP